MTLKAVITTKAFELVQLLEHCDNGDFIDAIVNAVASCDYAAFEDLQGCEDEDDE